MKVVIFGASGMLGTMVLSWFAQDTEVELTATCRDAAISPELNRVAPRAKVVAFDAESATVSSIAAVLHGADAAVNCIGVIKPYIRDDNAAQSERAVRVNALFPHVLARAAEQSLCRVLQIATDCVYSGRQGSYIENSPPDALDVYGKTKSLGEARSSIMHHLRCSIIGPEMRAHVSLLDWFLTQKKGAQVKGFLNHNWNGVTTLHFAKLAHAVLKVGVQLPHLQHVIPSGAVHKAELLNLFSREYQRSDIQIEPVNAPTVVDRTLATSNQELNATIWAAAGYPIAPTVAEMVHELAAYQGSVLQAKAAGQAN